MWSPLLKPGLLDFNTTETPKLLMGSFKGNAGAYEGMSMGRIRPRK